MAIFDLYFKCMGVNINLGKLKFYFWTGLVWLALWLFDSYISKPETFAPRALNEFWRFVYIVFINFIFFEYFLPFIMKGRTSIINSILIGFFLISIYFLSLSFGLYAWRYVGIQLHIYTTFRQATLEPDGVYYQIMEGVLYQAQGGIASAFFFGIAKLLFDNFNLKQTAQRLRIEKQEAELNFLKSQTNPHFLFNTLNNIYALSRDKSDLAPESILRLSKILRFMLYETGGEFITAQQELEIINDYISLEKMRYDDSLKINLSFDIDDLKQQLPPLLLIPLVENAFKHGLSETSNQPFLDIVFRIHESQLLFVIKNSTEKSEAGTGVNEHIGLTNVRKQLELLYTDYNLAVLQETSMFTTTLKINLASHV